MGQELEGNKSGKSGFWINCQKASGLSQGRPMPWDVIYDVKRNPSIDGSRTNQRKQAHSHKSIAPLYEQRSLVFGRFRFPKRSHFDVHQTVQHQWRVPLLT